MARTVILSAKRTPIGRFLGGLSRVPAPKLGAAAIGAALTDAGVAAPEVQECFMGSVLQAGLGQNPARQAALGAGLSDTTPCTTINKVCGSGLEAVMIADRSIRSGDIDLAVAGGMENMSAAPHLASVRSGLKFGDGTLVDHMSHDGLTCAFEGWGMGSAAEWVAETFNISREAQDAFAAASHQKATAAAQAGWFDAELIPLEAAAIKQRKDVTADEGIRGDSTTESLGGLRPAFSKDGTVTAGNASQISDGAAAVVISSFEKATELGVEPVVTIIDHGTVGVSPKEIFTAPAVGVAALLQANGLTVDDIDLFELNEAFAAQSLQNIEALGIAPEKINICGGAIALGHPIGGSGARVLVTLVHQMIRTGAKRGVVSLCLGGGNAVSMLLER
jgi:acetyl-CoA C-acetyltransferase